MAVRAAFIVVCGAIGLAQGAGGGRGQGGEGRTVVLEQAPKDHSIAIPKEKLAQYLTDMDAKKLQTLRMIEGGKYNVNIRRITNAETALVHPITTDLWYVIEGSGTSEDGGERIDWSAGDVFLLPGGGEHTHRAERESVLWVVTNEPQLAFEGFRAAEPAASPIEAVHYRADEILRQLDRIYEVAKGDDTAGFAIIFSSAKQEASRNIMPTLTLGLNSLPPGQSQRPHRHNSVAVALVIEGEKCWSMVDGKRKDWSRWATTVTPPTSVHSHHNGGDRRALILIVQDGGLYYHARTMGFSFA
jgi:gentisate 1,2-dioxygenase